jgi:hypothetical protein
MDYARRGMFCPLEVYADLSISAVVVLCFVFFLGCMLEFSSESACLPFVARDISIVIWSLYF